MPSFRASYIERLEKFRAGVLELLEASQIKRSVNEDSRGFYLLGPSYPWADIDPKHGPLQAALYHEYSNLVEIGRAFLADRSLPQYKKVFEDACDPILEMIEQDKLTWHRSTSEAKKYLNEKLDEQLVAVNSLHGSLGSGVLLIPDTNAFITNPHLHTYKVKERSTIILQPTIAGELDELKIMHRNEKVRKKALAAVRQLKELRKKKHQGDEMKVTEKITVCFRVVEPKFQNKPSWLDPQNNDDRFIASCLEVAAASPDSEVAILTLDINLQNKAEYSHFPFLDPEEEGIFSKPTRSPKAPKP